MNPQDQARATTEEIDRELIALLAAAVGADLLIVDVHPIPEEALCDAEQALSPADLLCLISGLAPIVEAQGKHLRGKDPVLAGWGCPADNWIQACFSSPLDKDRP